MNDYLYVFFALSIVIMIITAFFISSETFLERTVKTFCLYILNYYISAILLIFLDKFTVSLAVLGTIFLSIIYIFIKLIVLKEKIKPIKKFRKEFLIFVIFISLTIPFVMHKSEDIRMISDMGMYFERYLSYVYDDCSYLIVPQEIDLIDEATNENIDAGFENTGFYKYDKNGNYKYLYTYHGIPTWTSFMALFGKLFGYKKGTFSLSIFYYLSIGAIFLLCDKKCRNRLSKWCAISVYALSPVMIYISKATLNEISLCFFLLTGLFFLCMEEKSDKIIGAIFLGLTGFLHISMYIYIPIILVALLYYQVSQRNSKIPVYLTIISVLHALSLLYCLRISPLYTRNQLERFRIDKVEIIIFGFIVFNLFLSVISIILSKRDQVFVQKAVSILNEKWLILFFILLCILLIGIKDGMVKLTAVDELDIGGGTWALRKYYIGNGIESLRHLNIYNILLCTGILSIPLIIYYSINKKDKTDYFERSIIIVLFASIFVYTFMSIDTPQNYYASRYFCITIIPTAAIAISMTLNKKRLQIPFIVLVLIFNISFDVFFINQASFEGYFAMLEDIQDTVLSGDVVVLEDSKEIKQTLTQNLRIANNNLVFYEQDLDKVKDCFYNKNIYFIAEDEYESMKSEMVFYKEYEITNNLGGENAKYLVGKMPSITKEVYVYRIQ